MVDNFNIQQNLKRQLAAQKLQDRFSNLPENDATLSEKPQWLNHIQTSQEELAQRLTQHYATLLQKLPAIAVNTDHNIQTTYMHTLIAELVKIYYLRMRFVELDAQLTATIQQQRLTALAQECKAQVLAVTQLMKQYIDYHGAK